SADTLDQYFAAARTSATSCSVYVGLSLFDWRVREQGVGPDRPLGGGPGAVISQHLAAALKSSCHSRPAYQKQSRTGMRPSLLAGPQAGRDFREKAGNGAWP